MKTEVLKLLMLLNVPYSTSDAFIHTALALGKGSFQPSHFELESLMRRSEIALLSLYHQAVRCVSIEHGLENRFDIRSLRVRTWRNTI